MKINKLLSKLFLLMFIMTATVGVGTLGTMEVYAGGADVKDDNAIDVSFLDEDDGKDNIFQSFIDQFKSLGRDGLEAMQVIGITLAVLALAFAFIMVSFTKNASKQSELYAWIIRILVGIMLLSGATTIVATVVKVQL